MRGLVGFALLAMLGSVAAAPPVKNAGADLVPPQVTLNSALPAVATSYEVPYSATYSDNVELAYVRTASSNPFVFIPQGGKTYQAEGSFRVPIGGMTLTLMGVDTSGNVGKLTVSIASPDVAFKPGSYTISGSTTYPTGFDCRPAWTFPFPSLPLDGQTFGSAVAVRADSPWSVANGYQPTFNPYTDPAFSYSSPSAFSPTGMIPLNATSLVFDKWLGYYSGPTASVEARLRGTAHLVQTSPRILQFSIYMACNVMSVSGTVVVNGTTATFVGQLAP